MEFKYDQFFSFYHLLNEYLEAGNISPNFQKQYRIFNPLSTRDLNHSIHSSFKFIFDRKNPNVNLHYYSLIRFL